MPYRIRFVEDEGSPNSKSIDIESGEFNDDSKNHKLSPATNLKKYDPIINNRQLVKTKKSLFHSLLIPTAFFPSIVDNSYGPLKFYWVERVFDFSSTSDHLFSPVYLKSMSQGSTELILEGRNTTGGFTSDK